MVVRPVLEEWFPHPPRKVEPSKGKDGSAEGQSPVSVQILVRRHRGRNEGWTAGLDPGHPEPCTERMNLLCVHCKDGTDAVFCAQMVK